MRYLTFLLFVIFNTALFSQEILDFSQIEIGFRKQASEKNIAQDDIKAFYITDNYVSRGIQHVYASQAIGEIPILDSHMDIHTNGDYTYSTFNIYQGLKKYTVNESIQFNPIAALQSVANIKGLPMDENTQANLTSGNAAREEGTMINSSMSDEYIRYKLWYLMDEASSFRLVWEIEIDQKADGQMKLYYVDAISGEIAREINLTLTCFEGKCTHDHHHDISDDNHNEAALPVMTDSSYNVFAAPFESPHDGPRTNEVAPWNLNPTASPEGWHRRGNTTYTHTRGNNVDAYNDSNNSNGPTGGNSSRADGTSTLTFDFPWTSSGPVASYEDASITNLFYWNNIIHDIWFNYGFDEASGNFQEINYTPNGNGSDFVRAESQDGGGSCNANFATPSDGGNPRMQMYNCSGRDGSFDNVVVVHEYGHGISNRLTGGPSAAGCLGNAEQMGEGWSDWFGTVMTILPTDQANDPVGVGTWLFNQGPNGNGIRPFPYSRDMNVNPMTYATTNNSNISRPHGIGSVWATMLWDLTWDLIDAYGFDPDLYNGTGGNNVAMALVIEGCKLQGCSPGFVSGRDGILAADQMLYGGQNQGLIWEAFARRGLGFSASQGSTGSRFDQVEAFDLPPFLFTEISYIKSASTIGLLDTLDYSVKLINNGTNNLDNISLKAPMPDSTLYISSSGGVLQADTVVWPSYTILPGDSLIFSLSILPDPQRSTVDYSLLDNLESGTALWETSSAGPSSFVLQSNQTSSGNNAWFANDASSPAIAIVQTLSTFGVDSSSTITFSHLYDTEPTWDGGRVFLSIDQGNEWIDAGPYFTQNGYNSTIYNSIPGFSGNSGGFISSSIDLSSFAGESMLIRFQMDCDQTIGGNGWYIDDISFGNVAKIIDSEVFLFKGTQFVNLPIEKPAFFEEGQFDIRLVASDLSCGATNDGAIDLQVISGSASGASFLWNNGMTTEDITNIPGGTYSVIATTLDTTIYDTIRVLNGQESYIMVAEDNGDPESLRALATTNYCPNDTLIVHPSLEGQTITLFSRVNPIGNLGIIGLGKNKTTLLGSNIDGFFGLNGFDFLLKDITLTGGGGQRGMIFSKLGTIELDNVRLDQVTAPIFELDSSPLIIDGVTEIK